MKFHTNLTLRIIIKKMKQPGQSSNSFELTKIIPKPPPPKSLSGTLSGTLFPEQCKQPSFNGYNMTNRVLRYEVMNEGEGRGGRVVTFFCPAYLRCRVLNFTEINHEDLEACVNLTFQLTLNLRGLPPLIQLIMSQHLKLDFNKDNTLKVQPGTQILLKYEKENSIVTYIITKNIKFDMDESSVHLFPFGLIDLDLTVSIQNIYMNKTVIDQVGAMAQDMGQKCEEEYLWAVHELLRKETGDQSLKLKDGAKVQEIKSKCLSVLQKKHDKVLSQGFALLSPILEKMLKDGILDPLPKELQNSSIDFSIIFQMFQTKQLLEQEIKEFKGIQDFHIKFNFMDCDNNKAKISYSSEGSFGLYDMAERYLQMQFTDDFMAPAQKNRQIQTDQKENYSILKPFNYAHMKIPIYKHPLVSFTTIFLPLVLLGVINMGIYFQQRTLSNRIESLTNVMLAFVAFIPVIQKQLPFTSKLTMVQTAVYLQSFCCLLCFIQSMSIRNNQDYQFQWKQNGLYLANAAIEGIIIVVALWLLLKFYIYDRELYNLVAKSKNVVFDYHKWWNKQTDCKFRNKIANRQIEIVDVNTEKEQQKDILIKIKNQFDKDQEQQNPNQEQQCYDSDQDFTPDPKTGQSKEQNPIDPRLPIEPPGYERKGKTNSKKLEPIDQFSNELL